jgi:hypothetical protein
MAGDKDITMGRTSCAIGLVDAVENLKTIRVTAAGGPREMFRLRAAE